ncbi:MAG: sigma-70 family RNA polymerase sigma factor [Oscillospiraceae bacterium]|nr:sigma-70 family RNA polymerase sigma factor [Oscillospiraceae bacterium]
MTEEALIKRLRRGDSEAFLDMMDTYNRLLWGVAGGILKDAGTAEDVEECVSDVYLDLWRKPKAFNPKKGSLKTYLAVMARSRALDRYRQLARVQNAELDEALPSPEDALEDRLIARTLSGTLRGAVDALGEPDREIITRRYFLDEKPTAIAAHTSLPLREVNNRLYQSKLKLRKMLGKEEL